MADDVSRMSNAYTIYDRINCLLGCVRALTRDLMMTICLYIYILLYARRLSHNSYIILNVNKISTHTHTRAHMYKYIIIYTCTYSIYASNGL